MSRLSLESLQAFIACVDYGGFSKAAKKLHKSQATISILVSNLEDDLHINLFDRTGRSPILTPQGEIIYAYARNVVLARQELLNVTGLMLDKNETVFTLIISDYIPAKHREMLKKNFLERIDGMKLTLLSAESHDSLAMLLSGEADMIIIPAMKSRMNYPVEVTGRRTWFTSELNIYCGYMHPLSKIKNMTEHDIKSQRRVRLLNGTTTNNSPRNDIFTDDLFHAYRLCAQGFGWSELPKWVVENQHKLGDDRLIKLSIPPTKKILEFDIIYKNTPKGSFANWLINVVTERSAEIN